MLHLAMVSGYLGALSYRDMINVNDNAQFSTQKSYFNQVKGQREERTESLAGQLRMNGTSCFNLIPFLENET